MEWSVIHHNHGSLFQRRQKLVGKPELKKPAVHRSVILKRRKNPVTYLSSNNAAALILSSANLPKHSLTPQRIPIFPIQVCIYTAFDMLPLWETAKKLSNIKGAFYAAEAKVGNEREGPNRRTMPQRRNGDQWGKPESRNSSKWLQAIFDITTVVGYSAVLAFWNR